MNPETHIDDSAHGSFNMLRAIEIKAEGDAEIRRLKTRIMVLEDIILDNLMPGECSELADMIVSDIHNRAKSTV